LKPRIRSLKQVQRALLAWHEGNGLRAPWRESRDPYHCLVAAVMAQQTQMSRVMPSYETFVAAFPTIDALAAASLGDVIRVWAGMGYNQRAVRLHRAARTIAAQGWPEDAASLARIDGIGPFTAAIIASFAFGQTAACVDTNVQRVLGRLAGDEDMTASALQRLADASIPPGAPAQWNQTVMDYGARVCTPRPKCGECLVARWCASRERFAAPRAAADPRAVAEQRPRYRTRRQQPAYEGSPRWYRGRIIDALRELPPGRTITIAALAKRIANGAAPDAAMAADLVEQLQREHLAIKRSRGVSLPD
jgi:A/G-specific adenine glycosylase